MKRLLTATVAIMILLQVMPSITAHASTGLVVKQYRTELAKGEVVEDITVLDENLDSFIVDEIPTVDDDIIVDEEAAEPKEFIEEEIELDVAEEEIIIEDENNAEEIAASVATPSEAETIPLVDNHTEEIEEEENKNETEVQIP